MHMFDGYAVLMQPLHHVEEIQAEQFLARVYGVRGVTVHRIVTERDDTFAVADSNGDTRWVLKIENPAEPYEAVEMRAQALRCLEDSADDIPTMHIVPSLNGQFVSRFDMEAAEGAAQEAAMPGRSVSMRAASVTTFIDGVVLSRLPLPYEQQLVDDIGIRLAQVQKALADLSEDDIKFNDTRGRILWDVDLVDSLVSDLSDLLDNDLQRSLVERAATSFDRIRPILAKLPVQYCHGDFHPGNLIVHGLRSTTIQGIIDFGDMHAMSTVTDLGTCLTYLIDFSNGNHAFDMCRRALYAYRSTCSEFDSGIVELLPAIFKARIALAILLPIMVERHSGARPGHYLTAASNRFTQLEMLEQWSENEIVSMLQLD